jgi:hypothetical protein
MEIVIWLILVPLGGVGASAWFYRIPEHGAIPQNLRFLWSRLLGRHHGFTRGRFLAPREQERHRVRLRAVRTHSVDRQVIVGQDALCIVTDQRVMIENEKGLHIELSGSNIRVTRAQRDYDPKDGFSYWVVMERVDSRVHEPEGDIALRCVDQAQSQALFSMIQDTTAAVVSS